MDPKLIPVLHLSQQHGSGKNSSCKFGFLRWQERANRLPFARRRKTCTAFTVVAAPGLLSISATAEGTLLVESSWQRSENYFSCQHLPLTDLHSLMTVISIPTPEGPTGSVSKILHSIHSGLSPRPQASPEPSLSLPLLTGTDSLVPLPLFLPPWHQSPHLSQGGNRQHFVPELS